MFLFLSRKKKREREKTSLFKIKMWFLIFQLDIGWESSHQGLDLAKNLKNRVIFGVPTTGLQGQTQACGSPGPSHSDDGAGNARGSHHSSSRRPAFGVSGLPVPQTRRTCGGWPKITPLN